MVYATSVEVKLMARGMQITSLITQGVASTLSKITFLRTKPAIAPERALSLKKCNGFSSSVFGSKPRLKRNQILEKWRPRTSAFPKGNVYLAANYENQNNIKMPDLETIFSVGAGGIISLCGQRQSDGVWLFFLDTDESFHADVLPEEDKEGLVFKQRNQLSNSLEKALEQMDEKYPWYLLYPVSIHPEFFDVIFENVKKRCMKEPGRKNYLFEWDMLTKRSGQW